MATVKISQGLITDILKAASATQSKVVQRAIDSRPSNEWADKIYNTLWGDEAALAEKVPEHWFNRTVDFELESVGGLSCHRLKFSFAAPRRWPLRFRSDLGGLSYTGSNIILLSDNIIWGELYAEMSAWSARVTEAKRKCDEFTSSIRKLLDSYTTLAPALKAWPPLWDFVPEPVKNKHKEISTREKKAEVSPDVDLSTLTAMAVAAKIS